MQTANIAIALLVVLDLGIFVLVPHFDRWLYQNYPKEVERYHITGEEEYRLYRFIYTGCGTILISAISLGIALLSLYHGYEANW